MANQGARDFHGPPSANASRNRLETAAGTHDRINESNVARACLLLSRHWHRATSRRQMFIRRPFRNPRFGCQAASLERKTPRQRVGRLDREARVEIREPIPSEIMRRAENVSTLRGPVVSIAKRTGLGPVCRGLFSCVANGAQLVALCSFLHPEVIVNIDSDRGSPDSRFMQNWRQYCVAAELRPRTQHIDCGRHCTSNSRRPLTPLQSTIRITLGQGFRPRRNR